MMVMKLQVLCQEMSLPTEQLSVAQGKVRTNGVR